MFKRLKLKTKFALVIIGLLMLIFSILSIFIYTAERNRLIATNDEQMYAHLQDVESWMDFHFQNNLQKRLLGVALVEKTITQPNIQLDSKLLKKLAQQIGYEVIILKNKNKIFFPLHSESSIINPILLESVYQIFSQKSAELIYSFDTIPYRLSTQWLKDSLLLCVGNPVQKYEGLREVITQKKYFKTGLIYCMNEQGKVLIHPVAKFEGFDVAKFTSDFYKFAVKKRNGKYRYFQSVSKIWKWQYFTFHPKYKMFVSIAIEEKEFLNEPLTKIRNVILWNLLIAIFISLLIIHFLLENMMRPIRTIVESINELAKGKSIPTLTKKTEDEIGEVTESLNSLILAFGEYTAFAKEIEKENFDASFTPLSKKDILGNSLLQMRDGLKKNAEADRIRNWTLEGLAKFAEILRHNQEDMHTLAQLYLSEMVYYVGASQGGIFLYETNESGEEYLSLMASYAYGRNKILQKKIAIFEGVIGEVFQQGRKINLEDIPENYTFIPAGFADLKPRQLLILPIKTGEETMGVLEIATLQKLEPYKVELLEKLAESLATTLVTLKTNEMSRHLLVETQKVTEQLQQQDEELRQNMEELQALHEDARLKEAEIKKLLAKSEAREEVMKENIEQMKKYQIELQNQKNEIQQIRMEEKKKIEQILREHNIKTDNLTL